MSYKNFFTRIDRYLKRLNGCTIVYGCAEYHETVGRIIASASVLEKKSDDDLKNLSRDILRRARMARSSDAVLIEAFALVRETVRRVLKITPFDEQLIAGLVLCQGRIAEMQTGEGKTLAAVFAAYVNALSGKGVHVITFNDYLARRDAEWMGPVYAFLRLSARFIREGMSIQERQHAYNADITYVTAQEAGFDFLRDNLALVPSQQVHRGFHYAIIDEADSILVDEARVPLVIAGSRETGGKTGPAASGENYLAEFIRTLAKDTEYEFDDYRRAVFLTENGIARLEQVLQCGNLYAPLNGELLKQVNNALRAEYLLHRDKDYIVRDGAVELVDDFTGRVADLRRWPDGLHAAVEAKEACRNGKDGIILNSITLHYFLRQYAGLSGMTATAQVANEELRAFYRLHITVIPPHRKCVRRDHPDFIFRTKKEKHDALVREIITVHKTGRPILVGTRSVKESAHLAETLERLGLVCRVLNAKQDDCEAEVIAEAGLPGALTISTNMAGRGTDIRLGGADEKEKARVIEQGGLYVIGTNRNESLRIDNQLRGRAGRQGDPGSSRFFVSLEDDLCVRYRLNELIPPEVLSVEQVPCIDMPIVRSEMDRLQRIIEGQHQEIKKTICRYSAIIEQQRESLFKCRRELLEGGPVPPVYKKECPDHYRYLEDAVSPAKMPDLCRRLSLLSLDRSWSAYLDEIEAVREGIHLRAYGKQDPLYEYNKCAAAIFEARLESAETETIAAFRSIVVQDGEPVLGDSMLKMPSSTWTYLINDNPFDDAVTGQLMGDTGYSLWAGLLWPLTMLHYYLKKRRRTV